MKKKTYLYILFFLYLNASVFGQTSFVKTTNLIVYNNILVSDIGIDTSLVFFGENGSLGKFNKAGTIGWYKKYPLTNGAFLAYDLMRISDTTFCAFGVYNSKGTSLIIKDNGALINSKSYTLLGSFTNGVVMNTNRLLFLGINNTDFYLTKTDHAGTPLLSKKFTKVDAYSMQNNQALVKLNSNLFVVTLRTNIAPVYKSRIVTLAVDSSLNILWSRVMGGDDDDVPIDGLTIGSNCYIVSKTKSYGVGMNDIMLTCIDSLGNIVWNRTYGTSMNDELPIHVSMDADSAILISGTVMDSLANEHGFITKINRNGNIIWAYKYSSPAGYKNMSIHRTFKLPSGLLRAVYRAKKITNSSVYAGVMDIKPSGHSTCLSSYFQLTQKNVPLNPVNYTISVASVTPVATANSIAPINSANALAPVCSSICNVAADMLISSTRVCTGNAVNLQNNSFNYTSVSWLIDGTGMSNANSYTHVFNVPGNHSVSLVAFGTGCQDTITSQVLVDSFPVAAFSYTQQSMIGNFVNLSSWNEADLWLWGDGLTSLTTNKVHTFPGIGTYNSCLVTTNNCGTDTVCHPFFAYDNSNFTCNSFYGVSANQEWGQDVCQTPEGNLLLAGRQVSFGSAIALLEVNRSGNIISEQTWSGGETQRIISLGSKGYCVLSQAGSPANTGVMTFFVPGTMTSKFFTTTKLYCGYASKSSSFYAGGSNNGSKAVLIKMDDKFNKVWMKSIIGANVIYGLTELNNGTLLVVGKTPSGGGYLAKIDTLTGHMLWSKYYSTPNGMVSIDILYDSVSDHIYIAGAAGSPSKSFIIKADVNGNIIWSKAFALTNDNLTAKRCFLNQYGQLFLCYSTNRISLITCLDTDGNVSWSKNYSVANSVQSFHSNGYTLCYDGGIAITGMVSWSGAHDDIFVIKIDTSGINNTCFVTTLPVIETPLAFNLNSSFIDSTEAHVSNYTTSYLSSNVYTYPDSTSCSSNSCSSYLNYSYNFNCLAYTFNFTPPLFPFSNLYWDFGDGTGTSVSNPVHTFPGAGTYITSLSANIPGCGTVSYSDTIHIVSPTAPIGLTTQSFCNNAVVADLAAAGTGIQWYAASVGGTVLPSSTVLINGAHYFASQTVSNCESYTRLDVAIVINPLPVVTANATESTICNGNNVTLTGSGASTYSWSGGVQNGVAFNPNGTYSYTVIGTDVNGCLGTATKTIVVNPLPALIISNPSVVCSPSTFDISSSIVTFGSSGGTISYWQDSSATVSLNMSYYTTIDTSGVYYIKLDSGTCFDIGHVAVTINNNCVWPGDANKDSIVNNYDLLPIGLLYSQTGISRNNISNNWQAFPIANWGISQINGADIKHVDCNGDGIINNNDTLAVNLNYSSIHAIGTLTSNELRSVDPDLYFTTSSNSYYPGDWINIEVWTGSTTKPVANLYGIAFDISYDASLVQPGTASLTYPNSWFGTPGVNALKIAKIDELAAKAYGGLTRIDHSNQSGSGKIADFKFQAKNSITSVSNLQLSVSNYKANDQNGSPVVFNPVADSITIVPLSTSVEKLNNNMIVSILPNPFSSYATIIFSNTQQNTSIKIRDVLGKEIKHINFSGMYCKIERDEMKAGIYLIQITYTNNNIENRKIVIE
ncbi:MAG: T9SS type A sorting domain-containing protein [Bacteroidota bacterium]